jgi:thioredoxin reductase
MYFQSLVTLLPLLLTGTAALPTDQSPPAEPYDAVIIGGGPSGLTAAMALGRVRRNVLLLDSGEYRNDPTRHMHDVPGFDGVTPAYFRWSARQQLIHYPSVELKNGTVTKVQPEKDNLLFTVTTNHRSGVDSVVQARKVVLATGLKDNVPSTPGVQENWGKGIYWCPWCDGNEHADQPLGLLSSLEDVPGLVREILSLNTDIIAFTNGTDTPEERAAATKAFPSWERYLELNNVTIENRPIASLTRLRDGGAAGNDPSLPTAPEYDLFRVDFAEGPSVERSAFLASWDDEQRSKVGEESGVQLYGGRLAADQSKGLVTNIPGIYAIGDANADNVTNVAHALFSGKRAAVYLHVQIGREDSAEQLGLEKRAPEPEGDDLLSLWKRMNGEPGEPFYVDEEFSS